MSRRRHHPTSSWGHPGAEVSKGWTPEAELVVRVYVGNGGGDGFHQEMAVVECDVISITP